jgi:hypothetical protein
MPMITTLPDQLSPPAAALYKDLLATRRRTCSPRTELTPDQLPTAHELASANLATLSDYRGTTQAAAVALHPAFFQQARPPDEWPTHYIELWVPDWAPGTFALLAALKGGGLTRATPHLRPWDTWQLSLVHPTATDPEHDPVYLVRGELEQLSPTAFYPCTILAGRIAELAAWLPGQDPFAAPSGDYQPSAGLCTTCETPHPYGPYLPPPSPALTALANSPVLIAIASTTQVDAQGRLLLPTGPQAISPNW